MFDSRLRTLIDPPLNRAATVFAQAGISAEFITWTGLALGLSGAGAVAAGAPMIGFALFAANRLADGLDGAVARRHGATDRGGFLDIVCDFLIYATYPMAFAIADPARNALAAAVLLASFIASGVTFLAFAAIAAKRGLSTAAQGEKSIYYLSGVAEGFETIVALTAMCLWPASFAAIAYAFAAICAVSATARVILALHVLGRT